MTFVLLIGPAVGPTRSCLEQLGVDVAPKPSVIHVQGATPETREVWEIWNRDRGVARVADAIGAGATGGVLRTCDAATAEIVRGAAETLAAALRVLAGELPPGDSVSFYHAWMEGGSDKLVANELTIEKLTSVTAATLMAIEPGGELRLES